MNKYFVCIFSHLQDLEPSDFPCRNQLHSAIESIHKQSWVCNTCCVFVTTAQERIKAIIVQTKRKLCNPNNFPVSVFLASDFATASILVHLFDPLMCTNGCSPAVQVSGNVTIRVRVELALFMLLVEHVKPPSRCRNVLRAARVVDAIPFEFGR